MSNLSLPVAELFDSFQGEGPSQGVPARFVRLMQCNLHCVWCDTKFTWHPELSKDTVVGWTNGTSPWYIDDGDMKFASRLLRLMVVTGGEPMLYQRKAEFVTLLREGDAYNVRIEIETNGTIQPSSELLSMKHVHYNVSPKLPSANAGPNAEKFHQLWWELNTSCIFKFVITSVADMDFVRRMQLPAHRVWIMPEGATLQQQTAWLEVNKALVSEAIDLGYNFTLRAHVMVWGAERGR